MLISHARVAIPNSAANPLPTPFWRTKFRCGQSRPTQFKTLITLIFLANRGIFWTLGQILSLLSGRGSRPGRRAPSELRLTTGLLGRKVPPARHPPDADGDDREVVERHPLILRVARAEHGLRPVVLGAVGQDLGRAAQHDPAEPGPVLVPAIGDKSDNRVIDNISEALQCLDIAFRLLIDRDVECTLADDKTYRHEMRRCPGIGRRQVTDPAAGEKPALLVRQHARTLHDSAPLARRAASWQSAHLLKPTRPAMKIERIDHLNLTVADIDRSVAFYQRVLGMKTESMGEGRAALYFGQQKIHLDAAGGAMAMSGDKRMPAHICFVTDAPMGEVTAHLESCGVPVRMQGPRAGAIGTIQSVYIDDPDQHSIEIAIY